MHCLEKKFLCPINTIPSLLIWEYLADTLEDKTLILNDLLLFAIQKKSLFFEKTIFVIYYITIIYRRILNEKKFSKLTKNEKFEKI